MLVSNGYDSIGVSIDPTAVIAYEESKGADRLDSGKFVRYHEFAYNKPPGSGVQYLDGEPGCIISDPFENSRRVRFVSSPSASDNGLRMGVFWRQGLPTEGGPGDIMVRTGQISDDDSTGLRPENMLPAVDDDCRAIDYAAATELNNVPANNISSNTLLWSPVVCNGDTVEDQVIVSTTNKLSDTTDTNPYEDSRAHRAAIVGDDFYIGYSYAKDWALATYTDLDNYNFWIRHYNVASNTWTDAQNISKIAAIDKTHVKEPRLVKTPGTGMGGTTTTYPENLQDKNTFIVAWGTEINVYSHVQSSVEGDINYSRTRDQGVTYEDPLVVEDLGINNRFESQLRPSPAGNILWSVWNEAENAEDSLGDVVNIGTNAMLRNKHETTSRY